MLQAKPPTKPRYVNRRRPDRLNMSSNTDTGRGECGARTPLIPRRWRARTKAGQLTIRPFSMATVRLPSAVFTSKLTNALGGESWSSAPALGSEGTRYPPSRHRFGNGTYTPSDVNL